MVAVAVVEAARDLRSSRLRTRRATFALRVLWNKDRLPLRADKMESSLSLEGARLGLAFVIQIVSRVAAAHLAFVAANRAFHLGPGRLRLGSRLFLAGQFFVGHLDHTPRRLSPALLTGRRGGRMRHGPCLRPSPNRLAERAAVRGHAVRAMDRPRYELQWRKKGGLDLSTRPPLLLPELSSSIWLRTAASANSCVGA